MAVTNFIYGLLMVIIGALLVKYNFKVTNMFSRNNWFERKLGSGSSYMIFMLVSIGTVILGVLTMFGLGDNVRDWVLSPLKGIFQL